MHHAPKGDHQAQPGQGETQERGGYAFAAVELTIQAVGALLLAHPQELVDVVVAAPDEALRHGKHSLAIAGVERAAVGQQVDGQQEEADS